MATGKLRQVKPKGPTLRFQYNPEAMPVTGGIGGWARHRRPRRKTALEWEGLPERTITFTLLFDGFEDGRSVERECGLLYDMAQPVAPGKEPPLLKLEYGPVGGNKHWVIDEITAGEELRDRDLRRVRAEFTVTLVEHETLDIALTPAERHKRRRDKDDDKHTKGRKKSGGTKVRVARAGETLASIAAREFGDERRWVELAELNRMRDPSRVKRGQRVKIPRT